MFYLPKYVFYIFLSPKGRIGSNKIFIGMPIIPICPNLSALNLSTVAVTEIYFNSIQIAL